LAVLEVLGRVF